MAAYARIYHAPHHSNSFCRLPFFPFALLPQDMIVRLHFIAVIIIIIEGLSFVHCAQNYSSFSGWSPIENRKLNLFQGDIMIPKEPLFRSPMRNKALRWPDGIVYYTLDPIYADSDIEIIKTAMKEFEIYTCIRWVERTDQEDYVEIENAMGCRSEVGVRGGPQSVILESPLCMTKGVVMHELMHTLGFWHEMSRPDRDDYVDIIWKNIEPGMKENFLKFKSSQLTDQDLPYDYRSLMHYKAWAFSVDDALPTCTPLDLSIPLTDLGISQVTGVFTEIDITRINKFYECQL